jgi:hypothetical protein
MLPCGNTTLIKNILKLFKNKPLPLEMSSMIVVLYIVKEESSFP